MTNVELFNYVTLAGMNEVRLQNFVDINNGKKLNTAEKSRSERIPVAGSYGFLL